MIYLKPTQGDLWRALVSRWSRDERAACRSLLLWGVPADWGAWIHMYGTAPRPLGTMRKRYSCGRPRG